MTHECYVMHFPGFEMPDDPKDPRARYGRHCLELGFVCKNGRGAVVLQVMTGWYPAAGIIGEARHFSARMTWHLPLPNDPTKYDASSVSDCSIINQKCHGSSHSDHNGLWMKMLCYSTSDHFWNAMKKFHAHMTKGGDWNAVSDLVPNRFYLEKKDEDNCL